MQVQDPQTVREINDISSTGFANIYTPKGHSVDTACGQISFCHVPVIGNETLTFAYF